MTSQCEKRLWVRHHGAPANDCLAQRHQRPEIEGEEVSPPPAVCHTAEQRDAAAGGRRHCGSSPPLRCGHAVLQTHNFCTTTRKQPNKAFQSAPIRRHVSWKCLGLPVLNSHHVGYFSRLPALCCLSTFRSH